MLRIKVVDISDDNESVEYSFDLPFLTEQDVYNMDCYDEWVRTLENEFATLDGSGGVDPDGTDYLEFSIYEIENEPETIMLLTTKLRQYFADAGHTATEIQVSKVSNE